MADESWDRKPYGTLYPNIIRRSKVFISITMQKAQSLFKWNFVSVLYQISFAVWCCRAFSKVFSSFFTEHLKSEASIINAASRWKRSQPASIIEMWIVIEARGKSDKEKNVEWQGFTLSFNLIASTRHGRVFAAIGWQRGVQDWTANKTKFLGSKLLNILVEMLPKNKCRSPQRYSCLPSDLQSPPAAAFFFLFPHLQRWLSRDFNNMMQLVINRLHK